MTDRTDAPAQREPGSMSSPLPTGIPLSLGCIRDGICRAFPCICAQEPQPNPTTAFNAGVEAAIKALRAAADGPWRNAHGLLNQVADYIAAEKSALSSVEKSNV